MNITQQDYLSQLRRRLGNPSVTVVSDDLLTDAVNAMLRDYTRAKPIRSHMVLWLQPLQERYTLSPAPFEVYDVIPAAPTTASARAFGNEFRALELDLVSFLISDLEAYQYKVSQYRELFEQIEWNYNEPPELLIVPPPVQAMQAIAITGDLQTLDSITDADIDTTFYGAMAFALEFWANQRDMPLVMEAPSALGSVQLQNGDKLREKQKEYRAKFENALGWNKPFIGQG